MVAIKRYENNPVLVPIKEHEWEKSGSFNGSVLYDGRLFHLVYRGLSTPQMHNGYNMQVSSIGYAQSVNGYSFGNRKQFITPSEQWEIFGCEDPRVTFLNDKYFIFYTALSMYPFSPAGIKVGLAITKDFDTIFEKHPITPFNAKAMALFPEKINGKFVAILTVDTDIPPAKIAIAEFESENQMWSKSYWDAWHASLNSHVIPLLRSGNDQLEVGPPPIKTDHGWLLIYSYIQNYFTQSRVFGIEAVLLDNTNPKKIIGRTKNPLLVPQEKYEHEGNIPHVIFPSGAALANNTFFLYYGAADTTCCLATLNIQELLNEIKPEMYTTAFQTIANKNTFNRFDGNPIISPIPEIPWESKATFNPATLYENGTTHLLYRAMSNHNVSVIGYAKTTDGFHIDKRLGDPAYIPREDFESKLKAGANSGCEDPRLTKIDDTIYMCYTAYDGVNPPRVALTSIALDDFLRNEWHWSPPILISPPGVDNKDACLLETKINNKFVFFHRMGYYAIWIDLADSLEFGNGRWLGGKVLISPRSDSWDNVRIGIAGPPLSTEKGWLLLYHSVCSPGNVYKLGALLLDKQDPSVVLARSNSPIFEPETDYEKNGIVSNVVFPCGAVIKDDTLFIYYGGADKVIGVATMSLQALLSQLQNS